MKIRKLTISRREVIDCEHCGYPDLEPYGYAVDLDSADVFCSIGCAVEWLEFHAELAL